MEEEYGEQLPEDFSPRIPSTPHFLIQEPIKERKLTFEEASKCLNTLGKDESGIRYAYLMLTATDKNLTDISIILNFKHLLFVDISGNLLNLDAVQILSEIPYLIFLRAERNMIESAALTGLPYLQVLILNKNRITETCDISQPMLETLELGENLIYTAQFDPERLGNLKELSLQGNHLIDTSGTYPYSLEKLFLGQNKISKINTDFSMLPNLKILNLRQNNVRKLTGFSEHLVNLNYLNLRSNNIQKLRQFRKLKCLPNLETLIILDNPVCGLKVRHSEEVEDEEEERDEELYGEDGAQLKDKTRIPLLVLLPNLKRINKEIVTTDERDEAVERRRKITEEIFEEESSEDETEIPTTTDFTTDFTTETETDLKGSRVRIEDVEEHSEEEYESGENTVKHEDKDKNNVHKTDSEEKAANLEKQQEVTKEEQETEGA